MAPLAAATAVNEPSNHGLKLIDCPFPPRKVDMNARRVTFVPESLLADISTENALDAIFGVFFMLFYGILLSAQVRAKRKILRKETIICQTRSDAKPLCVECGSLDYR